MNVLKIDVAEMNWKCGISPMVVSEDFSVLLFLARVLMVFDLFFFFF